MKARKIVVGATLSICLLTSAPAAQARPTAEQRCLKGRMTAAAKFSRCFGKMLATYGRKSSNAKTQEDAAKCRIKYAEAWTELRDRYPGTTCDAPRWEDNGTTVTDHLTGLVWEKKTEDLGIHDATNEYVWSVDSCDEENGSAFSVFLRSLNAGSGFEGSNGWRLPTLAELNTILLPEPFPCTTQPCIDPVFGPLGDVGPLWVYLTSTPDEGGGGFCFDGFDDSTIGRGAWTTFFGEGQNFTVNRQDPELYVRAVRGGL